MHVTVSRAREHAIAPQRAIDRSISTSQAWIPICWLDPFRQCSTVETIIWTIGVVGLLAILVGAAAPA